MTTEAISSFPPTSIELQSITDSKIVSVSLYSTRAEITRLYKFGVHSGQNQVYISKLPNVLEAESLRVEGRGAATIHDVTLSMEDEVVSKLSPQLEELMKTRKNTANAMARCDEALLSLKQYLGSITVQNLAVSQLESMLEQYESTAARLDTRNDELTRELQSIDAEIATERAQIKTPPEYSKLRNRAAIGVFAQKAGDVEIALIYAVPFASWTAFYDIRVDMDTKESPVTLIYKAAVKQNTGESWDDIPLQLETSTPTFGLGVPTLPPWNVDIYQASLDMDSAARRAARRPVMSWYSATPGHDVAHITNTSQYTLLSGTASVYVGGSFIARSSVPAHMCTHQRASLDPSIRITYHPCIKKRSQSGFYNRQVAQKPLEPSRGFRAVRKNGSQNAITWPIWLLRNLSNKSEIHSFTQRITVQNTKSAPVEGLRIVDQIPASRNAQIKVNLVQPPLALGEGTTKSAATQSVNVAAGVVAQWDGGEERDRRVSWVCTVPARGKVNLAMEWTVTVSPADARVIGL
ncbi:mucoidy inhibitor A [Mycena polygramma]|nr:mucoidy inhibitor A [Mycena polygramma]